MLSAVRDDCLRLPGLDLISLDDQGSPEAEEAAFLFQAAQADATLVIAPECGGMLERRSRQVLELGRRLLGCQPDAIQRTADKWSLACWWQARQIPTPTTFLIPAGKAEAYVPHLPGPFPLVCKPRHGAGSQATRLIQDAPDLLPTLHSAGAEVPHDDLLVQPFISGRPASLSILVGLYQLVALEPCWQTISNDGRFQYRGGQLPMREPWRTRAIDRAMQAVAGIPGLRGYCGVDLILGEDGRDYVLEINPRLTTSYLGLRQLARGNLMDLWLQLLKGDMNQGMAWHDKDVIFSVPDQDPWPTI